MSLAEPAPAVRAEADTLRFIFEDRRWRVRGLDRQLSCERMKVNLMVSRLELSHIDTLDLYASRPRKTFVREAAAELYVEEAAVKRDLGRVLGELEARQEALIRQRLAREPLEAPVMTEPEREEALQLLGDPKLLQRVLADYEACGLVGEETNKLVCYLACVSRRLPQPLAVLIRSGSAAGKSALVEATLGFMPPEAQIRLSALTAQSLYYMGRTELKHKILTVAEQEGAAEASYALKLLQSEGRLAIACAGKDSGSGRQQTQHYEVEGPVTMLLTTTCEDPDPELASRCLALAVDEQPPQTAAIHRRQRAAYTPCGIQADRQALRRRQQNAQRLLQPLEVLIPFAEHLTFRTDQTRYRRDHAKYLGLIASLALLHQHQRKQTTPTAGGRSRRCVIATLEDVDLANRLAAETLAARPDALLPQSQQLLSKLEGYVLRRAEAEQLARQQVRFTQREARESLGWSDRSLRRHLARLVELEYLVVYRTGRGNQRAYQLLYDSRAGQGRAHLLGLADVDQLRRGPRKEVSAGPSHGRNGQCKGRTGTPAPPEPAACQTDLNPGCPGRCA
jgi:DNA primase